MDGGPTTREATHGDRVFNVKVHKERVANASPCPHAFKGTLRRCESICLFLLPQPSLLQVDVADEAPTWLYPIDF